MMRDQMYAISYKKHYVAFEGTYATQIYATFNCKKSHEGVVSTVDRILARDDGAFVTYLELKCIVGHFFLDFLDESLTKI